MQALARGRFVRGSARKMRQVVDLVRGKKVEDALNILRFTHKKSALNLEKVVRSAVANAQSIHGDKLHDPNALVIVRPCVTRVPSRSGSWRGR